MNKYNNAVEVTNQMKELKSLMESLDELYEIEDDIDGEMHAILSISMNILSETYNIQSVKTVKDLVVRFIDFKKQHIEGMKNLLSVIEGDK